MLCIEEKHHVTCCSICCLATESGMCLEHSLTASPVFCLLCQAGEHAHDVQETTPDWDPTWHCLTNQWPGVLGICHTGDATSPRENWWSACTCQGAVQITEALQCWALLSSAAHCCQEQRRMLLWLFQCHNKSCSTQQRAIWIFCASFSPIHLS